MFYQRDKNHCAGCRGSETSKPKSCWVCKIKNCAKLKKFCYQCDEFPCAKLKQLDKHYRTKYKMSMINNLKEIKRLGVSKFAASEQKRWACEICQGVVCVHRQKCLGCTSTKNG